VFPTELVEEQPYKHKDVIDLQSDNLRLRQEVVHLKQHLAALTMSELPSRHCSCCKCLAARASSSATAVRTNAPTKADVGIDSACSGLELLKVTSPQPASNANEIQWQFFPGPTVRNMKSPPKSRQSTGFLEDAAQKEALVALSQAVEDVYGGAAL
jgi:hypothetical protein